MRNLLLAVTAMATVWTFPSVASAQTTEFQTWLEGVRSEGLAKGLKPATLDSALNGLQPIERVLELDRRQPEFTRTFWGYLDSFVTEDRIRRGRDLLRRHAALLDQVAKTYGVQPRFLVAFWGMETNFGDYTGGFPVIGAVATLAHDERRSDFFRAELFHALKIVDEGHIAVADMKGSWAGAMGQPQFMPSTFTGYATDGNGDGRKDIWTTLPDVFASAANYLSKIGWDDTETWGREVRLPAGFDLETADLSVHKHISEWQALGVRRANGADLPVADIEGSIILPAGVKGPAFLVYGNFDAIMTWNRSVYYALAVGYLSDRLIGQGALVGRRPADEKPLHRDDIIDLQQRLNAAGFDTGKPDGMIGPATRGAVKAYQKANGLPPDGYPTHELLQSLRGG
ncbi:MAG: lytic murein transglycosylase [Alphaproteobacteria bacterium]